MTFSYDLEMEFTAGVWTSVNADVLGGIDAFWGARSIDISTRMADTGTLTFSLDNSSVNAGGTTGWYSPAHASVRSGFGIGTRVRVKFASGANVQYQLYTISDITPEPGAYRERACSIACEDYIGMMSAQNANTLAVQTNKMLDEAFTFLIAQMPVAPENEDYAAGISALEYIFQDVDGRKQSIYNIAVRLLASSMGYFYRTGNATDGETLVYTPFQDRATGASQFTLQYNITGMKANHAVGKIINDLTGIVYPLEIGTEDEVLWTSRQEIELTAGKTTTFSVRFTDPSALGSSVRLVPGSGVTPVADTDYRMSATPGGSGSDLNANLTYTVNNWYADTACVTLTNTAAITGYVNRCKLRGKIIRLNDPMEKNVQADSANLAKYGERPLRLAMPYQADPYVLEDFLNILLAQNKEPPTQSAPEVFEFFATGTMETYGVMAEIGQKFTAIESVTGISADYIIAGLTKSIQPGNILKVSIVPQYAPASAGWYLGEAEFSELGETTYLGTGF